MTEREWFANDSPVALLAHLNADGYSRKLLLYASAIWPLRPDLLTHPLQEWVAQLETVLAGSAEPSTLDGHEGAETDCTHLSEHGQPGTRGYFSLMTNVVCCSWISDPLELDYFRPPPTELAPFRRIAARFIRDIFGNPFRPIAFNLDWRTDTAVTLARQMYDAREFSAAPILADALQDAGCDNDDLLTHLRDTSLTHVRGCWAIDLVLGRE